MDKNHKVSTYADVYVAPEIKNNSNIDKSKADLWSKIYIYSISTVLNLSIIYY